MFVSLALRTSFDVAHPWLAAGEVVADGTDFRNGAHFRYKADILVPCGGRPESVNVTNVSKLWDSEGVTNFKYLVEGANLFVTQPARLALEKKGVILCVVFSFRSAWTLLTTVAPSYRDSSANKGGVTSSSLEVLAGMGLSDEEFIELMTSPMGEGKSRFDSAFDPTLMLASRFVQRLLPQLHARHPACNLRQRDCRGELPPRFLLRRSR